jgi:hypothetical protein
MRKYRKGPSISATAFVRTLIRVGVCIAVIFDLL